MIVFNQQRCIFYHIKLSDKNSEKRLLMMALQALFPCLLQQHSIDMGAAYISYLLLFLFWDFNAAYVKNLSNKAIVP